jgi:hypothetical protein
MDEIVVGIDVGTTKVCTLVGRVEDEKSVRILGVGIEPSEGIRKGIIVDLGAASQAIARSVEKAEQTSGLEVTTALVSLAGAHVSSVNSRGVAGVPHGIIDAVDVARALEQAQAVAIPHDREIVHIVQRGFNVDGQDGIRIPVGMHGFKLEVETHIITAAAARRWHHGPCDLCGRRRLAHDGPGGGRQPPHAGYRTWSAAAGHSGGGSEKTTGPCHSVRGWKRGVLLDPSVRGG